MDDFLTIDHSLTIELESNSELNLKTSPKFIKHDYEMRNYLPKYEQFGAFVKFQDIAENMLKNLMDGANKSISEFKNLENVILLEAYTF